METKSARKPPISDVEDHLGLWLRKVSNAVSGGFAQSLHQERTSVAEWVFLRRLYGCEETTPGEMAEALGMTRGAISKVIDKLEEKKWIRSRHGRDDKRVLLLSLTREGRRAVPQLARIADRNDKAFFADLELSERSALRTLLEKLARRHGMRDVPVE